MIMKKFYISIFATVFILSSFLSQGQGTYISILSNPLNYTMDDGLFWQGGIAPPNPCTSCTIKIYADVSIVQNGASSVAVYNSCVPACTFLNEQVLINSTINVYGNTTLSVNTYLRMFNSNITIGNDPTSIETIKLNDQVDLNGTSSITLANNFTKVDANDLGISPVIGPHTDFPPPPGNTHRSPGLFGIFAPAVGGFNYSWILDEGGLGKSTAQYLPNGQNFYTINCSPYVVGSPNTCGTGFVYGPAVTTSDPTYGVIFIGSTTLPVSLVQFLATKNDDGTVKLSWATSQETNAGYYDVERSGDQVAWTKIGSVKAKGNSSTATNYSFTDKFPLDGSGFYHLKMVDLDGKYKYSKTISVSSDKNARPLVIYSNPFTDQIRMKVNVSRAQNLNMTVTDMLGRTYTSKSYPAQAGDNMVNLPASIGGSGIYILRISGDSYNQTVKLEKQ
jgi:hypothetical protein